MAQKSKSIGRKKPLGEQGKGFPEHGNTEGWDRIHEAIASRSKPGRSIWKDTDLVTYKVIV